MAPILRYEDYTIAWICALPLEATAAMFMLDETHEGNFPWKAGQETVYTAGSMNGRNVVIACLSKGEYATSAAARVVSQIRLSFPNLSFGLMVGIGAGVPGPNRDIRLGDVVVAVPEGTSGGIVGYDLGKETLDGFQLKGWCNATDPALRSAIAQVELKAAFRGHEFCQYLRRFDGDSPQKRVFQRPGSSHDLLYDAERTSEVITRSKRHHQDPEVHYGLIASGDKVIKNAILRDKLRDRHDIICFEMEAAGLMNSLPVAVIRGICDYADSHKSDMWQPHAATAAAAYARGLLDAFGSEATTPHVSSAEYTAFEEPMKSLPKHAAVSTVPFLRDSKNFIGRGDLIAAIERGFQSQHSRLVLVGLGGIGKSQLAVEFSYRLRERQPNISVFWVHVNTPARFKQSFSEIARKVNLPKIEHPEHDFLQEVTDWLSHKDNGQWLLILDNCDDMQVLQTEVVGIPATAAHAASEKRSLMSYIPQTEHGLILATSRSKEVAFVITDDEDAHINVAPMTHREAVKLFHSRLPRDKSCDEDFAALAEELGYLPLAIKQAAAYMHNTHMSVSKYLEYFLQNEAIQAKFLLSDMPDASRDSDLKNSIISTWQISFDQILKQRSAAAELLALMSAFDRQSIPKLLLFNAEDSPYDPLGEIQFAESMSVLENYSLVTRLDDESFTMHRLVQFSTQKWLQRQKTDHQWQQKALDILSRRFPTDEWENWSLCEILYPHAQLMIGRLFEDRPTLENLATLLQHVGMYDKQQGRFDAAHESILRAHEIRAKYLGSEDEDTLACLDGLGTVLEKEGKWKQAESMHRQVLGIRRRILGDNDIHTLENINNLGVDLMNQGKYNEAEKLLRSALASEEKLLGEDSTELLSCMNHLGCVLGKQGKFEESIKLHRRALLCHNKYLGEDHPLTAETLGYLGGRLSDHGDYEEADAKLRQALLEQTKFLGPEHLSTLDTSQMLAENMNRQGFVHESHQMLEEIMSIQARAFNPSHPATLSTAHRIGRLLYESGKVREGIAILQNALDLNEKNLGRSHPLSLKLLQELASCYKTINELETTENLEREILALQESTIGPDNPDTIETRANLSTTIILLGKFEEAEKQSRLALEASQRVLGPEHPETAEYHSIYCYILGEVNQIDKAIEEFRKAIAALSSGQGINHPHTDGARHNLAAVLIDRGTPEDLMEAEALERYALANNLDHFAKDHPKPLPNHQFLAKTLLLQGRLSEAEPQARLAFDGCRRLLDPAHVRTGKCAKILTEILQLQGKPLDEDLTIFLKSRNPPPASTGVQGQKTPSKVGPWASETTMISCGTAAVSILVLVVLWSRYGRLRAVT